MPSVARNGLDVRVRAAEAEILALLEPWLAEVPATDAGDEAADGAMTEDLETATGGPATSLTEDDVAPTAPGPRITTA